MKRRTLILLGATAVIAVAAILFALWWNDDGRVAKRAENKRWNEIASWPAVNRAFSPDTPEPLVLYRDHEARSALYAFSGGLYAETAGATARKLLDLEGGRTSFWHSGRTILLATAIKGDAAAGGGMQGRWQAIDWQPGEGETAPPTFKVTEIADAYQDPGKILTVTAANDPPAFVFAIADDAQRYREFYYRPGMIGLLPVQMYMGQDMDADYAAFLALRPEQTPQLLFYRDGVAAPAPAPVELSESTESFEQTPAPAQQNEAYSLRAFADERGTIVIADWGGEMTDRWSVIRHAGYAPQQIAWKRDVLGELHPLLQMRREGDADDLVAFPFAAVNGTARMEPGLFEPEWRMVDERSFYKAGDGEIELVQLAYGEKPDEGNKRMTIAVDASLSGEDRGLLTYVRDGAARHLSVFDLFSAGESVMRLWLRDAPPVVPSDLPHPYEQSYGEPMTITLPQTLWDRMTQPEQMPEPVREAIEAPRDDCLFECDGETYRSMSYRYVDGYWHLLRDRILYRLADGQFVKLGELPITVFRTVGEGVNAYTALDFTFAAGQWVVADTFSDRVVRLDAAFNVTGELALPRPRALQHRADGLLEVANLGGSAVLDTDTMTVTDTLPAVATPEPDGPDTVPLDWTRGLYHEAPQTATKWVYMPSMGTLFVLTPSAAGNVRTLAHFTGYSGSGRFLPRIVPHEDSVWLFTDTRADQFGADGGYRRSVDIPPYEGKCDGYGAGEGSYAHDEERSYAYFVQGCRILALDLERGEARAVFAQEDAFIGALSLQENRVVFSMDGRYDRYSAERVFPHSNELVTIDAVSGSIGRFLLEKYWVTGAAGEGSAADRDAIPLYDIPPWDGQGMPEYRTAFVDAGDLLR